MLIKVGENSYEATFNAFTPIVFSRYFHVVNPNGTRRPKDINEAVGAILAAQNEYGFPPIAPLLEIFYACIKTATPKFDEMFDEWVSAFPADAYDLVRADGWASDVMEIVQDNFFPSAKEVMDTATAEEESAAAAKRA